MNLEGTAGLVSPPTALTGRAWLHYGYMMHGGCPWRTEDQVCKLPQSEKASLRSQKGETREGEVSLLSCGRRSVSLKMVQVYCLETLGSESSSPADFAMIYCQLLNRMDHCNYMSLLIFTVTTSMCQPHKV